MHSTFNAETLCYFPSSARRVAGLYPFVHMCYSSASLLSFDECTLMSAEGAQQGDPLESLLFCASSIKLAPSMSSEFTLWYLDDGSIGGDVDKNLRDLETVRHVGPSIGFLLNEDKCEIIADDVEVAANARVVLPNIRHVRINEAVIGLLGAPVG